MNREKLSWLVVTVLMLTILAVGCKRAEEPVTPPTETPAMTQPQAMPTPPAPLRAPEAATTPEAPGGPYARLQEAFAPADGATKATVDQVIAAVQAGKYAEALPMLQKLLADGKLTGEQQSLLKDLMAQVQKNMVAGDAEEAVAESQKAVEDVKKSLPFGQ